MCGEPIADSHQHVVNLDSRMLMCTCRACYLLFTGPGRPAVSRRSRPLPVVPRLRPGAEQWEELEIPVGLAFFFTNSMVGKTIAFYPGPAGATESELSLAAWDADREANPALAGIAPDVEALLVRAPERRTAKFACHLVPIDACYELVGALRLLWRGFDGGHEVHAGSTRSSPTCRPAAVPPRHDATLPVMRRLRSRP